MQAFTAEIRHAIRLLLKTPSFSLFAVLALALGIGANAAIFSLIDAVLLRPLQFHDPDRLVQVFEDVKALGFPKNTPAPANYFDWKQRNRVFADMAASNGLILNITGGDSAPEAVEASYVTANLMALLGVHPVLGRGIRPEENRPDVPKVALISYGIWQRRFGGSRSAIGKTIELDRENYRVIGVMPRGFRFPEAMDLWLPMARGAGDPGPRSSHFLQVWARLKPGVTVSAAQSEMAGIAAQLTREHPETNTGVDAAVVGLRDQFVGNLKLGLWVLLGGVGCLLSIACANVAGLMLARASGRSRELAVRAALGATRGRLIRHALTESLLLALAGGVAGCLLAMWTVPFLKKLIPLSLAGWTEPRIDFRVMLFLFAVSTLSALIFGALPAVSMSRIDLNTALQQGGRGGIGGGRRARQLLVSGEVALATVLLVGALLLTQTLWNLSRAPLGFEPEHVLTARTSLPLSPGSPYRDFPARLDFATRVLERIRTLPGVVSAGYTTFLPLTNRGGTTGFDVENRPAPPPGQWNDANHRVVSNEYLQTIGDRLIEGRYFDATDRPGSPAVAIVNEAMARKYWPGQDALGKRFRLRIGKEDPWVRIVGVVGTVRQMELDLDGRAEMYFPYSQETTNFGFYTPRDLAVRVSGDPDAYANAIRQAVWAVDRKQPVIRIQPMSQFVDEELASRDIQVKLICTFAAMALLLAALGLYGLLAFTVMQRVREIGVRMALGAREGQILKETVVSGMRLVAFGLTAGMVASLFLARAVRSLFFGVAAGDARTLLAAATVLVLAGAAACYFPARTAAAVDPMEALRYE